MGISREEQLLNELLRDVRKVDEGLDATDLEARVVEAFVALPQITPTPVRAYYFAAAALAFAVVLLARGPSELGPLPVVQPPVPSTAAINTPVEFPADLLTTKSPIPQRPNVEPSIAQTSMEFTPLMPLTERELTGSFQIVRVQMPRASLGALTSPFEHPSEVVEADVLLGEDGMARAIRVSTNGSAYSRRFR
jgi:hypothetical protein